MRKDFTHHDRWFRVLPRIDNTWWTELNQEEHRHIIHVPDKLFPYQFYYHYVENGTNLVEGDKLYKITPESTREHRRKYLNRWHISLMYLIEEPITAEWREQIEEYKRRKHDQDRRA